MHYHGPILHRAASLAACALAIAVAGAQTPTQPQTPPPPAQAGGEAADGLRKVLQVYAAAKTYQATWSYSLTKGEEVQKMNLEVRAKPPSRLSFRVMPAPGGKTAKGSKETPLPEMTVNIDGTTACFVNAGESVYFQVPFPAGSRIAPLHFFPQIPDASDVKRLPDATVAGKAYVVLEARRADGSVARIEIDPAILRIKRIVQESMVGLSRVTSVLMVEKEVFDAEIPDAKFAYKPPKGYKEIPAPAESGALFAPPAPAAPK